MTIKIPRELKKYFHGDSDQQFVPISTEKQGKLAVVACQYKITLEEYLLSIIKEKLQALEYKRYKTGMLKKVNIGDLLREIVSEI